MKKILSLICYFCLLFSAFSIEMNSENLVYKEDFSAKQIVNLKCNLTFENIATEVFYGDEITVEIYCNNLIKTPVVSLNKDSLEITSTKQKFTKGDLCYICLYIPRNFTFSNITINSKQGNIDLKNLEIYENLKINSETSNITIDNSNASYVNIKLTSGSIDIKNQILDYFDLNTTAGSISIDLMNPPVAKSILKTNSGNITVSIPKFADFSISAFSKTGIFWDLYSNKGQESAKRTIKKDYHSGGPAIICESSSGNIHLKSN